MKRALLLGILLGLLLGPGATALAEEDTRTMKNLRRAVLVALEVFPEAWKAWQGMQRREEREALKDRLRIMKGALDKLPELEKKVGDLIAALEDRPNQDEVEKSLNELRTDLLKQLADLQESISKLERTLQNQDGRLIPIERLVSPNRPAKVLLVTGRVLNVFLKGVPDDQGIKVVLDGEKEPRDFGSDQVLVVSVHSGAYLYDRERKQGVRFVPNTADPTATPRKASALPFAIDNDSPARRGAEAHVILIAMSRGEREDLYSYARRRDREIADKSTDQQLEWVQRKLAAERIAEVRQYMNETGCTDDQAFRIVLHLKYKEVLRQRPRDILSD